jgi:hypothetical protein
MKKIMAKEFFLKTKITKHITNSQELREWACIRLWQMWRNPAKQNITWTRELGTPVLCVDLPTLFSGKPPGWISDTHRQAVRPEP